MLEKLKNDESGGVITTELVLVATTIVTITLAAMSGVRKSVEKEFQDFENTLAVHARQESRFQAIENETQRELEAVELFRSDELLSSNRD